MEQNRKEIPCKKYIMGVDIGGTKIQILVEDLERNCILTQKTCSTGNIEEIIAILENCINKANISKNQIIGMGIGFPGRVDSHKGLIIDAPALRWRNIPIKTLLVERLGFPIVIENDVNLALLGDKYRGGMESSKDIFYLAIGTGLGSAIMANNQLARGCRFSAGEVAYLMTRQDLDNGSENKLGDFGVMEKKISGTALGDKSRHYNIEPLQIFEAYSKGNIDAKDIIEDFIKELSILISNVTSLLNPEVVILGGGVSESMGCVIGEVQSICNSITPITTRIILSPLQNKAAAFGAIELVKMHNFPLTY